MKYRVFIFISFLFFTESTEYECHTDADCHFYIENSFCEHFVCQCPSRTLLSSDGSKCLNEVSHFGADCEDNVQCSNFLSTGGVCTSNKCSCRVGFHYQKGQCWKNVDLKESCRVTEQCFSAYENVGLECVNEKCKCRSQYYQRLESGCRRKRLIGETCNLDTDCPEGAICNSQYICTDQNKTVKFTLNFEEDLLEMEVSNELGGSCVYDSDCPTKYAVCLDGYCACTPVRFVASEDNMRCLTSSRGKVEDIRKSSCQENVQCAVFGGNSICKDRKCACKAGTYWEVNHQFCWPYKLLRDKCKVTEDCHPSATNTECKNNICVCKEGYYEKENFCYSIATKVGDYCKEDSNCSLIRHSFCNETNACTCKENYFVQSGQCVRGINSDCETYADCCHLRNTKCRSTNSSSLQCVCLDQYVSSDKGDYCLPGVKYEEKCEESFQCRPDLGQHGECGDKVCRCKKKTHYTHGKCYLSKFVKESCSRLQDCHPGNDTNSVICLKGLCSCNYGYEHDRLGLCVKTNPASQMKSYFFVVLAALFFLHQRS